MSIQDLQLQDGELEQIVGGVALSQDDLFVDSSVDFSFGPPFEFFWVLSRTPDIALDSELDFQIADVLDIQLTR